ncbi:response regulator transcription factor [Streptomyces luteoverticillatus]|uniref:Response regulator transcription factor n=1 Tax=Streptomyces luteoverticillatus TaxID=66425 RepID=A0A3Q9FTD8_STRLT|nr:response regulator transcription factor [Streptomyces luteoverticillatus]
MSRACASAIRVVLTGDEPLCRGALAALLEREADFRVVAQTDDCLDAVGAVTEQRPDLVVLDLEPPARDAAEAARTIRRAGDVPIVLLTRCTRPGALRRALAAGVHGYVPKSTDASKLAGILRGVHSGERYVDPQVAALALTRPGCPLTARELDVLLHTRRGNAVTAIAQSISLSPGTVRNYLSSAMHKLNARTRFEAAELAWEEGWL